uniref:GRF-type domain-containing protein n=1 Tax=Brassica oleracea var. oleracea TaxID=109376 RepID=A0A0D3AP95_BRAOL
MSASSSTTGGRRRVRTPGIPSKCWCGVCITELISKINQNPYCRYYRCIYAVSLRLENDNHVFKWVDEAFTDEIQQLDNQVRMLEEEVQFLKATII